MRRSEQGFTLVELVVTTGVLAILAGIAVVMLRPAQQAADLRTLVSDTANAIRLKASAAATGKTEYFTKEDIRAVDAIAINPRAPRLPGTVVTTDFALQGGTGTAYYDGARAVVSIVLCEASDHAKAYAIVVGTAGRVEIKRINEKTGAWEALDDN